MMEEVDLEKTEEEFANSWIRQFGHILGREFEGNFILRIYYFTENYAHHPGQTVHDMISLMVALRALEMCGPKLTRKGTAWGYLERDMPKFRRAMRKILDEDKEVEKIDELFLLFNTIDMLSTIKDSKILEQELHELFKIVNEHQVSFDKAFEISPGLKVYAADLVDRIELPIKVSELPKVLSGKPGAFSLLMRLRMGQIPSTEQLEGARHPSALHLWWIAKAWSRVLSGETLIGILPFYQRIDSDAIFRLIWGDTKELYSISVTDDEMSKVLEFTGQEIKQQICDYFIKHPKVTDFSRTRLPAERDKADAGGEISDFNVEFTTGKEDIWTAIPIKSGRESGGKSRDKMEQNYLYQFIRPIVNFETNKIIVFPIILVKPTLNANEFLTLIRARLQLPIIVLDIEMYTRFLKREKFII